MDVGSPQAEWHLLLVPSNGGHSEGHLLRHKSQVIVRTIFLVTRKASDNHSRDCSTRALIQMLKAKRQVWASAPSPTSRVLYRTCLLDGYRRKSKVNLSRNANQVSEFMKSSSCLLPTQKHWPEPPTPTPRPLQPHSGCPSPVLESGHPAPCSVNS